MNPITEFSKITARKARAWRHKLNLYIGILFPANGFMETSETNRLLNEYFAPPSTFELDGFCVRDGPEREYGKVSDKSDYLLFRMREAVKTFTYSTEHQRQVAIAKIDSRRKSSYREDLFLFIRNVFPTDEVVIYHLEEGIKADEDLNELKTRFGTYEFENVALWDQLLAWLERYVFPMFEDHVPLRIEQLRNLVASRKLEGKYIEKIVYFLFLSPPLHLTVNYDLGETLDDDDAISDTERQPRKRTRSVMLSTTAQAEPEEHKGLVDKEADCCICYNRLPDETGVVLYCGHMYCDTCVETLGPKVENDCPYKCVKE